MDIQLLLVLIGAIIFIVLFLFIEPLFSKQKINSDNEYGSARFSTFDKIKKRLKYEKIDHIKEAGYPIWFNKILTDVWFDKDTPHWCLLGSTGSGKSVTSVIPVCNFIATSENKRSAFITDSKCEIHNATSKLFKDNGYHVLTKVF